MGYWNAFAGFLQGIVGAGAARAEVRANNMLSRIDAETKNTVRVAQNAATAGKNNLARWMQSTNNNRVLKGGGQALEANVVNYRRAVDQELSQSLSGNVRSAEQHGQAAAAAAFNGVDGSVVDMINGSVALRDSLVAGGLEQYREFQKYDEAARAGSIMSQMIGGMDNSLIMDTLDFNKTAAVQQGEYSSLQYGLFGMVKHMGGVSTGSQLNEAAGNKWNSISSDGSQAGSRQADGLSYRTRGDNTDLADRAYDTKYKFGFDAAESRDAAKANPYSIGGANTKFGESGSKDRGFWSR